MGRIEGLERLERLEPGGARWVRRGPLSNEIKDDLGRALRSYAKS